MRIQTQLFLGTAVLVSTMMLSQWWLQQRQLDAIEQEWSSLATVVGQYMLEADRNLSREFHESECKEGSNTEQGEQIPKKDPAKGDTEHILEEEIILKAVHLRGAKVDLSEEDISPRKSTTQRRIIKRHRIIKDEDFKNAGTDEKIEWVSEVNQGPGDGHSQLNVEFIRGATNAAGDSPKTQAFVLIKGLGDEVHELNIGEPGSERIVRQTQQESLAASALLLLAGLGAAAIFANRVTKPLRTLTHASESLAQGNFGLQIPISSTTEAGELQRAFNDMSQRLRALEAEQKQWRAKAHLAELGGLARGLAHTLRNPLHTLGLAVEELAHENDHEEQALVQTCKGQIHRIDRWLRSFLALGAGQAVQGTQIELNTLMEGIILENHHPNTPIELTAHSEEINLRIVAPALRAALSNLLNNATEASPPNKAVYLSCTQADNMAEIRIEDQGTGLPDLVREHLFSPHVTTKAAGSGMGLFLAKQLIEGALGGQLRLEDASHGGTIAIIKLPLGDF